MTQASKPDTAGYKVVRDFVKDMSLSAERLFVGIGGAFLCLGALGIAATIEDAATGHEQVAIQDAWYTAEEIGLGSAMVMTGKVVPAALAQTVDQLVVCPQYGIDPYQEIE